MKAKAAVGMEISALGDMWASLSRVDWSRRKPVMRALAQLAGITHEELQPK
jgi:hypothetical protein